MGVRTLLAGLAAVMSVSAVVLAGTALPGHAATAGPACGQRDVHFAEQGITIRILFAKNGTVQRYQVTQGIDQTESVNNELIILTHQYGPAGVNAPPLKIISFRKGDGEGGMMVPDKAVDSCGRTLTFN
ncbi:MAG: hypothetical protein ACYDGM_04465 [Vulcanimicrobiaceae bacterium]